MTDDDSQGRPPGKFKGNPKHRGRKFRGKKLRTSLPRPEAAAEAPIPPPREADRIAKVIARAGLASRREAEAWIAAGRVSVNGQAITSPALNVKAGDTIAVDGKPLPVRERTRLYLFHKPRGLVTTSADPEGRPTIFGALPKTMPRVVTIGRLDMNTEGLLLLTNDGGLARALELPATGWLRRYRVRAYGKVLQNRLDGLRNGIVVDGVRYGAIEATLDREQGDNSWITFAMREGKNREIRNVLGELGLKVNRLIRLSYGPFQLGELPAGQVEEISTRALREQLGERLAAIAGADFSGPIVEREIEQDETPVPSGRPEAHGAAKSRPHRGEPARGERPRGERPDGERPVRERPDRARPPAEARSGRDRPQDRSQGRAHDGDSHKGGQRPGKGPRHRRHASDRAKRPRADRSPHNEGRPPRGPFKGRRDR